ncbi:secreted protein [Streptomyces viridochromogenes DSM 40736]|uniref:Secreted protein n=1 Tax=Streptomyces viridochromogenes (strain DSM 40736 / JCM 4977 / BCRC 1201 / Tue 494) TaxID=591159 RepID=D9XCU3_STRVT|nr:secreted protein [Streptomyces viridochromogenes DSM 40736]
MSRVSRAAIVSISIGSLLLCGAPAFADNIIGGGAQAPANPNVKGDSDGSGTLSSTAGVVVFDRSDNGSGQSAGSVKSATTWTPPACYYAPKYTPDQLEKTLEPVWQAESTGYQWDAEQRDRYVNGHPYKDFNKEKKGKGYWWASYVTPGREGDPGALDCDKPIFWVDNGDPPPPDVPEAITPEVLAQLAYAEIRVPSTTVELAPQEATKVNLPTWAWLDGAKFKPVSVTAGVPLLNIQATTTAEPVSLKIEPGTDDAVTYPGSGKCRINADGSIGEPYAKGKADEAPPCGVKYLRSSGDGSYKLQATVTWKIHWTGTGVQGERQLPDGTFGAQQDVVVQEIQSVNR